MNCSFSNEYFIVHTTDEKTHELNRKCYIISYDIEGFIVCMDEYNNVLGVFNNNYIQWIERKVKGLGKNGFYTII